MVKEPDAEDLAGGLEPGGARSSLLGSRLPEGWLWATMTAEARSVRGSAKTAPTGSAGFRFKYIICVVVQRFDGLLQAQGG